MPTLEPFLERTVRGSIVWPVPAAALPALPATLDCAGVRLERKSEFHLTVLGHEHAATLFGRKSGASLLARWRQAWRQLDRRIELRDELWLLRMLLDDDAGFARSLAVACRAPAIAAGRRLLAAWTELTLPDALPHITLFWHGDPRGIAVPDRATWRERCVTRGSWASFGLAPPSGS